MHPEGMKMTEVAPSLRSESVKKLPSSNPTVILSGAKNQVRVANADLILRSAQDDSGHWPLRICSQTLRMTVDLARIFTGMTS
jgi:hypothetical protein